MDKQQQVLSAALSLFVEHGFHGTPTAKIAQVAGVANGTLFHYYKTKDELVVGLYNVIKDEMAGAVKSIVHESDFVTPKFYNTYVHTLSWALSNRQKFYYVQQFENSPHIKKIASETIQQHAQVHTQLLAEGVRKKLLQPHPLPLMNTLYNSQLFGVFQYLTNNEFTPEEEKKIIIEGYEMIWDMLKFK